MQNEHKDLKNLKRETELPFTHSESYKHSLDWDKKEKGKMSEKELDNLLVNAIQPPLTAAEIDLLMQ